MGALSDRVGRRPVLIGGFTPLVATAVGSWVVIATIAAGVCVAACVAVLLLRETRTVDLTRIGADR